MTGIHTHVQVVVKEAYPCLPDSGAHSELAAVRFLLPQYHLNQSRLALYTCIYMYTVVRASINVYSYV